MNRAFYIVGIGASAGGLKALNEFFDHIPPDTAAAFVVITHLNREKHSILTELLAMRTRLPIARVEKDVEILPGHIYVLTENTALTIEHDWLKVSTRDHKIINSSVDIFFKSLAIEYKERAIGIILSGGGYDGLAGALQLKASGGKVMAQNLLTAEVHGMPGSIIDHDHPSDVLNPTRLAEKIVELCRNSQAVLPDRKGKQPGSNNA